MIQKSHGVPIRIISKNIRYATKRLLPGEQPWSVRKDYVVNELRFNTFHSPSALILCQEVLHGQLQDILAGLNELDDQWDFIGWGREDGKEAGEYSPILYRPAVWQVLERTRSWFSPTPDKPSKDEGAGSIRILTGAVLKHRTTSIKVAVYCTHLDNQSSAARQRAADTLVTLPKRHPGFAMILAGDFNSEQNQEAYQTVAGPFEDVSTLAKSKSYGNSNTFTGFDVEQKDAKIIDYIFCRAPDLSAIDVREYAVLANRFDDGVYNSDHRAVVADILLSQM